MNPNRLLFILRRDYFFSRFWGAMTISMLGLLWLFFELNEKNKLPFFQSSLWSQYLNIALKINIFSIFSTPLFFLIDIWIRIRKKVLLQRREKIKKKYIVEFSSEIELRNVVTLGRSLVGDNHIDLDTLNRRYKINPNIVTCIYSIDNKGNKEQIIGYYILYPLTIEAYFEIHNTNIKNGRDIKDKHIATSFLNAAALYIGMAGGIGGHADGYVIEEMLEQISPILYNGNLKSVCTRAATKDGNRIVSNFGFQKLAEPSEISCLPINRELLLNKRIKRHLAYR